MGTTSHETEHLYSQLYERLGKSMESRHHGEYLVLSPSGETVLGPTLLEVAQQATEKLGPGHFIYKVGEIAVGKWR